MDFEQLNPNPVSEFPPSLGKNCEILEDPGSVKVIFTHGKVNKIM